MNAYDLVSRIFSYFWWFIVFICGCVVRYYVIQTRTVSKQVWQKPDQCLIKKICESIEHMMTIVVLIFLHCWQFAYLRGIPWQYCCPVLQISLCVCLWLCVWICAIIQEKVMSRTTWSAYMDKRIDEFLAIFAGVRWLLQKLGTAVEKMGPYRQAIAWFVWVVLSAVAVFLFHSRVELMIPLAIVFCVVYLGLAAYNALHSCRRLLLFWLKNGIIFALCAAGLVNFPDNIAAESSLSYVVFTIVYTLIWLLLAGAADDAPAQMGCAIINTVTTLLLIAANILAIWGEQAITLPEQAFFSWRMLQDFSVIVLLPLVVGGYLAALLKQFQVYWKNRTPAIPQNKI